jgi:hypothetical protein
VVAFPQVSPPKSCMHLSFPPYVLMPRPYKLRIKDKFHNLSIINILAPTKHKEMAVKENFYKYLQKARNEGSRNNLFIIIADCYAKIGKERCSR